jgi:hypothetical protein
MSPVRCLTSALLLGAWLSACGTTGVTSDAGVPIDAGASLDAGTTLDAGEDAGQPHDAGHDAGTPDAGPPMMDAGSHTGPFRVLFDGAHKQVEGNADWVLDSHFPDPQPAMPTSATSWTGGISSWGFDLHQSGRYAVHQLGTGSHLSWGGGGAGDLQQFDVFISDEPEADFTTTEQQALVSFGQHGGGIFLISDHSGASRCSGCIEAWQVINGFLHTGAGDAYGIQCDGNDVGASGLTGSVGSGGLTGAFSGGPFGNGQTLIYHSGSTVSLLSGHGTPELIVSSSAGGMMAASELPSGGRLVVMGDSSPADDGACQCSATLENGWGEGTDREVILNATAWLAHDGS